MEKLVALSQNILVSITLASLIGCDSSDKDEIFLRISTTEEEYVFTNEEIQIEEEVRGLEICILSSNKKDSIKSLVNPIISFYHEEKLIQAKGCDIMDSNVPLATCNFFYSTLHDRISFGKDGCILFRSCN